MNVNSLGIREAQATVVASELDTAMQPYIDSGNYSKEQLDNIYGLALHEIKLANKAIVKQGRTPGAEPNMQPYKDWIAGGKTEDGYKKVRREKRMYEEMTGYPNQIGVEQMPGSIWDKIKRRLFD